MKNSDGITKDEIMETLLERLGNAALPLRQLGKEKLYALEQALNSFEIKTRVAAQDRLYANSFSERMSSM
jgi:hypothetical protein